MSPAWALEKAGYGPEQIHAFYQQLRNVDEKEQKAMLDDPSGWAKRHAAAEGEAS